MAGSSGSSEQWSSMSGFLLAAVGFAVGMGNIWRFPYVLGENGGSAFLIIYLAFALGIGLPLLITEITIGRRGQSSATGSYQAVAAACGRSKAWRHVGTLGIFSADWEFSWRAGDFFARGDFSAGNFFSGDLCPFSQP